jgi:hypothetical protein
MCGSVLLLTTTAPSTMSSQSAPTSPASTTTEP